MGPRMCNDHLFSEVYLDLGRKNGILEARRSGTIKSRIVRRKALSEMILEIN